MSKPGRDAVGAFLCMRRGDLDGVNRILSYERSPEEQRKFAFSLLELLQSIMANVDRLLENLDVELEPTLDQLVEEFALMMAEGDDEEGK